MASRRSACWQTARASSCCSRTAAAAAQQFACRSKGTTRGLVPKRRAHCWVHADKPAAAEEAAAVCICWRMAAAQMRRLYTMCKLSRQQPNPTQRIRTSFLLTPSAQQCMKQL
jgi:hypothetical protein